MHQLSQRFKSLLSVVATKLIIAMSLVLSSHAIAHPGHDHHSNHAMLVHLLFYSSIVVAIAVCAWFGYRFYKKQHGE